MVKLTTMARPDDCYDCPISSALLPAPTYPSTYICTYMIQIRQRMHISFIHVCIYIHIYVYFYIRFSLPRPVLPRLVLPLLAWSPAAVLFPPGPALPLPLGPLKRLISELEQTILEKDAGSSLAGGVSHGPLWLARGRAPWVQISYCSA